MQEIAEQAVRVKGRLFIEHRLFDVAAVYVMLSEGCYLVVTPMACQQLLVVPLVVTGIAEQSNVSLSATLENSLER